MKTLKIECQLTEQELATLAVGLGWQNTKTVIDSETGKWENVENDMSHGDFIIAHFVDLIKTSATAVLVQQQKAALQASIDGQMAEIETQAKQSVEGKLTGLIS